VVRVDDYPRPERSRGGQEGGDQVAHLQLGLFTILK
jgi:hypothetical protein